MEIPSLLFLTEPDYQNPGISKSTIEDSRLSELITQNAVSVLNFPCSKEEIEGRQAFFKELDGDVEKYNYWLSVKSALVSLDSCEISRRSSISRAEKAFKRIKQLKAFMLVVDKIKKAPSQSLLVTKMQRFWCETMGDYMAGMERDTVEADRLIESIGQFVFRLDANGFSLIQESARVDYVAELDRICNGLNVKIPSVSRLNLRIEGAISDGLEKLYPEIFKRLYEIERKYDDMPERELCGCKRELDFYYEIIELKNRAGEKSIPFCYPKVSEKICFSASECYDISLLHKKSEKIVPNDITFEDETKFCFLTGANGGGKTTYLRTVAINLILAVCGCPVFCGYATVHPFTRIITHFPEDERFSQVGRLVEEQERINKMLEISDNRSFLLFNETFSGTDDVKGCQLTVAAVERLKKIDAAGLFVTHFHQVAKMNLPMLSTMVDEGNDNARLFKIVMKNGGINSSFANDILKKYRLDRLSLESREV